MAGARIVIWVVLMYLPQINCRNLPHDTASPAQSPMTSATLSTTNGMTSMPQSLVQPSQVSSTSRSSDSANQASSTSPPSNLACQDSSTSRPSHLGSQESSRSRPLDTANQDSSTSRPLDMVNQGSSTSRPLDMANQGSSTLRPLDLANLGSSTFQTSDLSSQVSSTSRHSVLSSEQSSTFVPATPESVQSTSHWPSASSIHTGSVVTERNSVLKTTNGPRGILSASRGNAPSTFPRSLSVSSSTYAITLPVKSSTTKLRNTANSSTPTGSSFAMSASSTSSGDTISGEELAPSNTKQQQPITNRRPTTLGSGLSSGSTFPPTRDSGHLLDNERNRTDATGPERAERVRDVIQVTTLLDTVNPDHRTHKYTLASTELIFGPLDVVNRQPNCERLNDGTYKIRVVAEVESAQASDVIRNLTQALSGIAGFISTDVLNTTTSGLGAEALYEVVVSVQRLVCKLRDIREDLRVAVQSLPADVSSSIQLKLGEVRSDIETICANRQLCPEGFVCQVTSQLTCVSLCDDVSCGDHGHCALNQTFQPVCICNGDGAFIYIGEHCDVQLEGSALVQIWRRAAVAGLVISGLFTLAIALTVALYLWIRWNGRKVSQRVSPEGPAGSPDSPGHNSTPENRLELGSGTV